MNPRIIMARFATQPFNILALQVYSTRPISFCTEEEIDVQDRDIFTMED